MISFLTFHSMLQDEKLKKVYGELNENITVDNVEKYVELGEVVSFEEDFYMPFE